MCKRLLRRYIASSSSSAGVDPSRCAIRSASFRNFTASASSAVTKPKGAGRVGQTGVIREVPPARILILPRLRELFMRVLPEGLEQVVAHLAGSIVCICDDQRLTHQLRQ